MCISKYLNNYNYFKYMKININIKYKLLFKSIININLFEFVIQIISLINY